MSRHRRSGDDSLVGRLFQHGFLLRGWPLPPWALKFAFLARSRCAADRDYSYWVSHNVFAMYQLMFAIITPALIVGAMAERMKFAAIMLFVAIWMFVVYFPIAHMVWGIDGLMNGVWNPAAKITAIDFAGGTVVHMSSGWSALVLCLVARTSPRVSQRNHGAAQHGALHGRHGHALGRLVWFQCRFRGSAADGVAANAFMTTTIAAAVGFVPGP